MSYQDRLKHLKLPRLAHRRRGGDIIQCFETVKGQDDILNHSLNLLNQELIDIVAN